MQLLDRRNFFDNNRIRYIGTSDIRPNPNQPRRHFDERSLAELADSIRQIGIIQPLTVRRVGSWYELVAGERRLRAAKLASVDKVPCIITGVEEEESTLIALVENLQRRDLDFIEEAQGIARLITTFGLSQDEAARRLGKSQSAVANKLRILKHPPELLELIRSFELTERHARALLRLEDIALRERVVYEIKKRKLNVAQTEALVDRIMEEGAKKDRPRHTFVVKDVRLFVNTIKNALTVMQNAGVDADMGRDENEENIILTIKIPKKQTKVGAAQG